MIKSMTGFGRARAVCDHLDISVEIKAVNHRYFEMYARVPRFYMQLEDKIRSYLQTRVVRGKIEVNLSIDDSSEEVQQVKVNKPLMQAYLQALQDVSETFSLPYDPNALLALRFSDVISPVRSEVDVEKIWQSVLPVLEEATDAFIAQRQAEGTRLATDIMAKCQFIKEQVDEIERQGPRLLDEYAAKLRTRIEGLLSDTKVDEQRLLTEVAIMADRLAVDEEIVRLNSHCQTLHDLFESGTSNGKKMDFIIQEMNREINTISSKIGDIDVTRRVIEVKTCIEKIREQVQNIE